MDVSLIDDKVFARFSFSSKKADGYFNVLDYECVNGARLPRQRAARACLPAAYNTPGAFPGGLPGVRLGSQVPCAAATASSITLGDENVQSGRAAFRFLINERDGVQPHRRPHRPAPEGPGG